MQLQHKQEPKKMIDNLRMNLTVLCLVTRQSLIDAVEACTEKLVRNNGNNLNRK